ncbi:YdbL family protein [Novosphingobium sp. G106]|uniref:YdbL family protein n=1 Tax=Novosphingobium sp. G106 TaxID=2849500 RepID=UPI001C2D9B88|nr:YdbL family protein [Novosphingobium sp. G106]MBV1686500.1 YdbL family protein [Novosphingobium sp. G106]
MLRSFSLKPLALGAALAVLVAGAELAQAEPRDPAYSAAREAGQVGEKMDGYLGVVGGGSPALRAMVDDLNIKRRAVYSQKAQAQHATVEEYAFTSGCLLIGQTSPGEKYQAPDGSWQTRGSGAPQRDSRCP